MLPADGASQNSQMLPAPASARSAAFLSRLDEALPGWVEGFYVVGSLCLGAFRPGCSDLDFVAVAAREPTRGELMRLRRAHMSDWLGALAGGARRGRWPLACNGIYLRHGDLARSSGAVTPIAAQVAEHFAVAPRARSDVNPVTWHLLARRGIAIRGPDPRTLDIHAPVDELRAWTLGNLNGYWPWWAARTRRGRPLVGRLFPRRYSAGGVLGAPRLHYTIATGEIATKEQAGSYALDTFASGWHPLIQDALAFRRGERDGRHAPPPRERRRETAAFVMTVVDSANAMGLD